MTSQQRLITRVRERELGIMPVWGALVHGLTARAQLSIDERRRYLWRALALLVGVGILVRSKSTILMSTNLNLAQIGRPSMHTPTFPVYVIEHERDRIRFKTWYSSLAILLEVDLPEELDYEKAVFCLNL
ncbi:MAG: hypothetical protein COV07_01500 [Candidatus Vogelbacteria bacterium CG10_big_fil_rev_8_21_14_0_10_45_14]|uniref:Uncharacterized protein n=1 Tax=Candidatus Vogelbacteria bacterium CG10_big_fil_rev_8_21_14_0_10_45_14 TaxID=1975042 RepID=A0A2H0RKA0_9BACT|nr:MAG: hypothetical protein COV07_01500 [Candidatus Vogelbacteria bacterium CG10_big_fil_rev_8_21_14_0_10_45_14]